MTVGSFEDALPPPWREADAPGAVVIRPCAITGTAWRRCRASSPGAVAALDHARRARDVGGDELVRQRLDQRQPRLPDSKRDARSGKLAGHSRRPIRWRTIAHGEIRPSCRIPPDERHDPGASCR
ncbi:hypothetical protein M8494_05425 [Serratia ureilytica]